MAHDSTPVTKEILEQTLQTALQVALQPLQQDVAATKAEVEMLKTMVIAQSQDLREFRAYVDMRFKRVNENIDRVIALVGNKADTYDEQLNSHERRIKRLEKKTGLAQTAA